MTAQEHAERIAPTLSFFSAETPPTADDWIVFSNAANPAALTALLSERTALLARVGELEADLRVAKSFGDLWYFVMDENPSGFEKIISEWSSSFWLDKAIDLRRAALKGQP